MPVSVQVRTYSGFRADERPVRFSLGSDCHEVVTIEDRWRDPDAEYFKVRTIEGRLYVLRHDRRKDAWTLTRAFERARPHHPAAAGEYRHRRTTPR